MDAITADSKRKQACAVGGRCCLLLASSAAAVPSQNVVDLTQTVPVSRCLHLSLIRTFKRIIIIVIKWM